MAELAAGFADRSWRVGDRAVLGIGAAVVTALDVLWRSRETRPPHWDMGSHLANSVFYLQHFTFAAPWRILGYYTYYPPGVYWTTDVVYAVAGSESMLVAVASNGIFLALLLFATYGIGRTLWNRTVGLLATVFVVTAPMMVSAFKEYMLDPALTAVVALAIYLLIRCENFAVRRYAVALGLVCGYGMLVKWTFALVVALPIAFAVGRALVEAARTRSWSALVNLALGFSIIAATSGWWYVHNYDPLRRDIARFGSAIGATEGDPRVATFASALWYGWNVLGNQLYVVPAVFLAIGLVCLLANRETRQRNLYPVLWLAGTYVAFTLLRNKDARYTMPALPAMAIIATSWLQLLRAHARRVLSGSLVAYGAVVFVAITFGIGFLPGEVAVDIGSNRFDSRTAKTSFVFFAQHGYLHLGRPTHENWHQQELFASMDEVPPAARTFRFEGEETVWFNDWGLTYFGYLHHAREVQSLAEASFLITRGREPRPPRETFGLVEAVRLPDGSPLALYRRRL